MVTVDRTFDADTHPDLRRNVTAVAGDGRARHVYAKAGAAADVLATWRSVLGDAGWVVPSATACSDRTWPTASATWSWPRAARPPSRARWRSR